MNAYVSRVLKEMEEVPTGMRRCVFTGCVYPFKVDAVKTPIGVDISFWDDMAGTPTRRRYIPLSQLPDYAR